MSTSINLSLGDVAASLALVAVALAISLRTSLNNRVSAILAKRGVARPDSDLFGPVGTRFWPSLSCARARAGAWTATSR